MPRGDNEWQSRVIEDVKRQAQELKSVETITGRIVQNYKMAARRARELSEFAKNIGTSGMSEFSKLTGAAAMNAGNLGGQIKKAADIHTKLDRAVRSSASGYGTFSQAVMGVGGSLGTVSAGLDRQRASLKAGSAHLARYSQEAKKVTKTFADIGVTGAKAAGTFKTVGVTGQQVSKTFADIGVTGAKAAGTFKTIGVTGQQVRKTFADIGVTGAKAAGSFRTVGVTGQQVRKTFADIGVTGVKAKATFATIGVSAHTAANSMARLRRATAGMDARLTNLRKRLMTTSQGFQGLTIVMAGLTYGMGRALHTIVEAGVSFERLRVGMQAIIPDARAANEQFERLIEVAKLPGLRLEPLIRAANNLQSVGLTAKFAAALLAEIGNTLAQIGLGAADLYGVTLGIRQMVSQGKVLQEELNQITSRIPQLNKILIETFGTAHGEKLQKLGITVNQFLSTMLQGLQATPRVAETAFNKLENLGDTSRQLFAKWGESLLGTFKNVLDMVSNMIDMFTKLNDTQTSILAWSFAITTGFTGLTFAVSGFMAILPFLIDGLKALGKASKFLFTSPWGLAITGIAAVGFVLANLIAKNYDARSAAEQYSDALRKQNEVTDETIKKLQEETDALKKNRDELVRQRQEIESRQPDQQRGVESARGRIQEGGSREQLVAAERELHLQLESQQLDNKARQQLEDQIALLQVRIGLGEDMVRLKKDEQIINAQNVIKERAELEEAVQRDRERADFVKGRVESLRRGIALAEENSSQLVFANGQWQSLEAAQKRYVSYVNQELTLRQKIRAALGKLSKEILEPGLGQRERLAEIKEREALTDRVRDELRVKKQLINNAQTEIAARNELNRLLDWWNEHYLRFNIQEKTGFRDLPEQMKAILEPLGPRFEEVVGELQKRIVELEREGIVLEFKDLVLTLKGFKQAGASASEVYGEIQRLEKGLPKALDNIEDSFNRQIHLDFFNLFISEAKKFHSQTVSKEAREKVAKDIADYVETWEKLGQDMSSSRMTSFLDKILETLARNAAEYPNLLKPLFQLKPQVEDALDFRQVLDRAETFGKGIDKTIAKWIAMGEAMTASEATSHFNQMFQLFALNAKDFPWIAQELIGWLDDIRDSIYFKQQVEEIADLTEQLDELGATLEALGARMSVSKLEALRNKTLEEYLTLDPDLPDLDKVERQYEERLRRIDEFLSLARPREEAARNAEQIANTVDRLVKDIDKSLGVRRQEEALSIADPAQRDIDEVRRQIAQLQQLLTQTLDPKDVEKINAALAQLDKELAGLQGRLEIETIDDFKEKLGELSDESTALGKSLKSVERELYNLEKAAKEAGVAIPDEVRAFMDQLLAQVAGDERGRKIEKFVKDTSDNLLKLTTASAAERLEEDVKFFIKRYQLTEAESEKLLQLLSEAAQKRSQLTGQELDIKIYEDNLRALENFSQRAASTITSLPNIIVATLQERNRRTEQLNQKLQDLQADHSVRLQEIQTDEFATLESKQRRIIRLEQQTARRRLDIERDLARARDNVYSTMIASFIQDLGNLVSAELQRIIAVQLAGKITNLVSGSGFLSGLFGLGAAPVGAAAAAGTASTASLASLGPLAAAALAIPLITSLVSDYTRGDKTASSGGSLFHNPMHDAMLAKKGRSLDIGEIKTKALEAANYLGHKQGGDMSRLYDMGAKDRIAQSTTPQPQLPPLNVTVVGEFKMDKRGFLKFIARDTIYEQRRGLIA